MSQIITENFSNYLKLNSANVETSADAANIIKDETLFENFIDTLLEGYEGDTTAMRDLMNRQRESILIQENVETHLGSPDAITATVASFPMLLDQYNTPMLSEITTVHSNPKPVMSIMRLRWDARIIDENGDEEVVEFPTLDRAIRVPTREKKLTKTRTDVITEAGLSKEEIVLGSRFYRIKNVEVMEFDTDGSEIGPIDVPCNITPDHRGNSVKDIKVNGSETDAKAVIAFTSDIKFDSGIVTFGGNEVEELRENTNHLFGIKSITIEFKFVGTGTGKGSVKVKPRQTVLDVRTDVEDSFEIEAFKEILQDWDSLFNMDLYSQYNEMIKTQFALNREFDIAELLANNEINIDEYGHLKKFDLAVSEKSGAANVLDTMRNIVPVIISLKKKIFKKTRFTPNYIVCGLDAGTILESLQTYTTNLKDNGIGVFGGVGGLVEFNKMKIISSPVLPEDTIYLVNKERDPAFTCILDIQHKPRYTIKETTNSKERMFIRSRNNILIVRDDTMGCIKLQGYKEMIDSNVE